MSLASSSSPDQPSATTALERWAPHFARLALGAAFLSAVGSRFGLWQGRIDLARFAAFIQYTGEVNAFLPSALHPILAWAATAAELTLGLALIANVRLRWAGLGSALLLTLFGVAMAISQGIKSPLDYSVFSAAAAALLVGLHAPRI